MSNLLVLVQAILLVLKLTGLLQLSWQITFLPAAIYVVYQIIKFIILIATAYVYAKIKQRTE